MAEHPVVDLGLRGAQDADRRNDVVYQRLRLEPLHSQADCVKDLVADLQAEGGSASVGEASNQASKASSVTALLCTPMKRSSVAVRFLAGFLPYFWSASSSGTRSASMLVPGPSLTSSQASSRRSS
eukprot:CAMPEP_0115398956 /NCGR_PEP_ID=MMETSP0271-20121206/14588_1 /TAXON_ID=71861 /ORGANISM="Scrippsiella trochoidea, Strain CCMP3099" /LENGTH=125 /DNA_ID=CAMNT_0002822753 /DNA_START=351 /DNA_END=729 /DNA_ORIENTATION=+